MSSFFRLLRSSSKIRTTRYRFGPSVAFAAYAHPLVQSWLLLFRLELIMQFRRSTVLRKVVRCQPIISQRRQRPLTSTELCHAIDVACVLYFKKVHCLQRSAAASILLRQHGFASEMITGAQIFPYEFHAWVEIDGAIVNDKPYMHEIYQVLERC